MFNAFLVYASDGYDCWEMLGITLDREKAQSIADKWNKAGNEDENYLVSVVPFTLDEFKEPFGLIGPEPQGNDIQEGA